MADISRITLPNGNTYDIKDTTARNAINSLLGGDAITFGGVTSTALTDGGTQNPTVDSAQVNPTKGQLYFYGTQEFLWDGAKWIELGTLDALGSLAYKDKVKYDKATSATYTNSNSTKSVNLTGTSSAVSVTATTNTNGNYQPAGTVSQPTFTGTAGSVSVSGKASFTGTGVRLVTGNIAVPTSAKLTSNAVTASGDFTPHGSVGLTTTSTAPAITGTVSTTSTGNTFQIKGSNTAPTISVKTAGTTDNTLKPVTAKSVVSALAAAAPGATAPANAITYYSVSDETLSLYQIGATKEDSVTLGTAVTVKTGDAAYQATAPTFTGQYVKLTNGAFDLPTAATFTGTEETVSTSGTVTNDAVTLTTSNKTATVSPASSGTATYTPGGTIGQATTGADVTFTGSFTPDGTVSQPTFTGTKVQLAGSTTATGSVTLPTISLSHTSTEATYE